MHWFCGQENKLVPTGISRSDENSQTVGQCLICRITGPKHRHSFTLSRRVPARSCANHRRLHSVYSVIFSPHHLTKTNDLKLPEIKAAFLFCNISTVETSLWGCAYPIGLFGWAHKFTALVGIASLPAQVSPLEADRRRDGGWCRNYLRIALEGSKTPEKVF
jgi:hypothetical protein